ncbi:MAG: ABC transporter permease [Deltaproteobacteria bacterium]|nr:ABC transporter permease [Deltaproteobacteria bacterium]
MNTPDGKTPWKSLVRISWRSLWRNRRRTYITLSGISLGFALTVFFIGIGDGGHNNMIRNAVNMGDGHLTIQREGYLDAPMNHLFIAQGKQLEQQLLQAGIPGRVAPRIQLQVLASTSGNSIGAALTGIQPETDPKTNQLKKGLVTGEWLTTGDPQGVVVGARMAEKLKVKTGSKIVLMAGSEGGGTNTHLVRVRGVFRTGIEEYDSFVMISSLDMAQAFLVDEGANPAGRPVTRVAVFLDDESAMGLWKARLKALSLPAGLVVLDWQEMMPQLVSFVAFDNIGNYISLVFIFTMVAFGILNTIMMGVLERTREFGLLRALGMSPWALFTLVVMETFWLSLTALAIGWVLGGGLHAYFALWGLDMSAMYPGGMATSGTVMDSVIYSELSGARVGMLTGLILGITLLSGLYPAYRALRVTPLQALQT